MLRLSTSTRPRSSFSALQRAEIAEIYETFTFVGEPLGEVSVLFNEPKLLKWRSRWIARSRR